MVDPNWLDDAVRAIIALEAIYGPHTEIAQAPVDCVIEVWFEDGYTGLVLAPPDATDVQTCVAALRHAHKSSHGTASIPTAAFKTPNEPLHRCGTCDFGQDYTCNFVRISTRVTMRNGSDDGGYLTDDNGPPWDCRFWRQRSCK